MLNENEKRQNVDNETFRNPQATFYGLKPGNCKPLAVRTNKTNVLKFLRASEKRRKK